MEKYFVELKEEYPKYLQVAKHIKYLIDSGSIEDGERLPSIRQLSKVLEVNSVTIVNAYKKLQSDGYADLRIGSGTYAKKKEVFRNFKKDYSETFKKISSGLMKTNIDFTGETTSSGFFPVGIFKEVLNDVLDRDGAEALIYQDVLGYEGLRSSISNFFWNGKVSVEDILIVSGAQQGIDIVSKSLINVNDNIIIEKPTYSGALSVFNWRRANIFEVAMEKDGVNTDDFERILKKIRIKCFYTMSYFQNPTGITYSYEKKKQLLNLASKYDFYIIEDDYLSELIYSPEIKYDSFKSLDTEDRVIYIKSFSKIFLPGIRIGYLICPPGFREVIQSSKINTDISTSSLMQRALDLYINRGYWREHIDFLNKEYRKRYFFMEACLNNNLTDKVDFIPPQGGLNFFLKINEGSSVDCMELFNKCKSSGVLITPGVIFYMNPKEGMKFFRLGFSLTDEEQIEQGIEIIKNNIL